MKPVEIQDLFQLSPYQAQLFSDPGLGCMQHQWSLRGPVELAALARSFERLVQALPVLRTSYLSQAGRPVQRVERNPRLVLNCLDLGALSRCRRRQALADVRRAARAAVPRRLIAGQVPVVLIALRCPDANYIIMTYHAIALDEPSRARLLGLWFSDYHAQLHGICAPVPKLPDLRHHFRAWPASTAERSALNVLPQRCSGRRTFAARVLRCELPPLPAPVGFSSDLVRAALWGLLLGRLTHGAHNVFQVLTPPEKPDPPLGQCLRPRLLEFRLTAQTQFVDLLHQIAACWADAPVLLSSAPAACLVVAEAYDQQPFAADEYRDYCLPAHGLQASWRGDAVELRYDPRAHPPALAKTMLEGLSHLINGLRDMPAARLCALAIGQAPRWLPPVADLSRDPLAAFTAIAHQRPQLPALCYRGEWLTYGALLERALAIAELLRARCANLPRGTLVALALADPVLHLQALLAALLAGQPFLPLDARQPLSHLEATLDQAKAQLVLCDLMLDLDLPQIAGDELRAAVPSTRALQAVDPSLPAYIIPTSGTTGQPKGVILPRAGLANTLAWRVGAYAMGESHRALQVFAPNFDGYLTSALTPLLAGAALVLPENHADPVELQALLRATRPTHLLITPSHLAALLAVLDADDLASVTTLTLAGERLEAALLAEKALAHMTVVNEYGPTENSVASTWHPQCAAQDPVPIGTPIPGCAVTVVDRWGNEQPPFGLGELILSGVGLAFGYDGDPRRTAAAFRPHPSSGRCYHSGDLGYVDADGRLYYVGRCDQQRKLRGYRVDPAELARTLERHPEVTSAQAWIAEDKSGPHLVAQFRGAIPPELLRDWLKQHAPSWLQPRTLSAE